MRNRIVLSILILGCAAASGGADDEGALLVKQQVEKVEKVLSPDRLVQPEFLAKPDGQTGQFILLSSAIGKDAGHGIRYSWLYEVSGTRLIRLFKLPFDATEMSDDRPPQVKGFFWVYDCYVCDGPETGYLMKVPVAAAFQKGRYVLKTDFSAEEADHLKKESLAVLDNARVKYGKTRKEPVTLKSQLTALFGKGLTPQ